MNRGDLLAAACQGKDARSGRISSWDQKGRNEDSFVILPGETALIADLEGPGAITHIWVTQMCRKFLGPSSMPIKVAKEEPSSTGAYDWHGTDPDFFRKMVIKMYWDNQEHPSVLAPLGDFFCVGHSMPGNFNSLPFTVSAWPAENMKYGGNCAMNCYLTMPFNKHARIEIENQGEDPLTQYFYIDYELYRQPLPPNTYYFHAMWKRENPTKGWAPVMLQTNSLEADTIPNLDGKDNYVILDTKGAGNYIGCNHSVTNIQGTWWGEGDDMIFIDDDTWPPSMHGTGSEDYFNQAWDMNPHNAYTFNGSIIHETDVPQQQVSYRFHLADPVRFSQKLKVTMEHGNANHLSNDWASTAYWYQTLPGPKLSLPEVKDRLPRRATIKSDDIVDPPKEGLDPLRKQMWEKREQRYKEHIQMKKEFDERRSNDSKERAKKNVQYAKDLRERWMKTDRMEGSMSVRRV